MKKRSFNEPLGGNERVQTEVTRHTNHSTRGERRGAASDPPRARERGAQDASGALSAPPPPLVPPPIEELQYTHRLTALVPRFKGLVLFISPSSRSNTRKIKTQPSFSAIFRYILVHYQSTVALLGRCDCCALSYITGNCLLFPAWPNSHPPLPLSPSSVKRLTGREEELVQIPSPQKHRFDSLCSSFLQLSFEN